MSFAAAASFVALALFAALASGCSRKDAAGAADAAPDGPLLSIAPDASARPSVSVSDAGFVLARVAPVEARRLRVAKLAAEPALGGAASLLGAHFAGAAGPFDVQIAELTAAGRRAVLVAEAGKATSDARPITLVVDGEGAVLWSKESPVAGIMTPVGPIALGAAPRGRVALAVCDPPTSVVALRLFDDDGSPFADFQALSGVDSCDALSLLYWPGRGWILAAARPGQTRARLVTESGALAWGDGLDLGVRPRAGAIAAPALVADTDDTFVLAQLAQPSAVEGSPFHALAFRYDTRGAPIWKAAVDVGALEEAPAAGERVKLTPLDPGVRVTLPSGAQAELRPSGDVVSRRPAPR